MKIRAFDIEHDLDEWLERFARGNCEEEKRLIRLAQDYQTGIRMIYVCNDDKHILGYVTLLWNSDYPPFKKDKTVEMIDLMVHEMHRYQGVGQKLIHACEQAVREQQRYSIGLTVNVHNDIAQKLYAKMGYDFDGSGLWLKGKNISEGDVTEEAVLIMTKQLSD